MLMCVVFRATIAVTAGVAAVTITAVVTPVTAPAVAPAIAPTPACDETAVMAGKNALSNDEDKSSTIPKQTDVMI